MRPARRCEGIVRSFAAALVGAACNSGGAATVTVTTTGGATSGGVTAGPTSAGTPTTAATTTSTTADAWTAGVTGSSSGGAAGTSSTSAGSSETGAPRPRPDLPPPCEPLTCAAAGKDCGSLADGCGGEVVCGECVAPATCGGAGVDNVCGAASCVAVRALFFDLGDTLVESDGGDKFVTRPGVDAMLAELQGLGMRLGVITNTPPGYTLQDLEGLLVDPGLLGAFEVVMLSSQAMGPPKPDAGIYGEAYATLSDPPALATVAYVSENLAEIADAVDAPTQGARAAGMLGVHLSARPPSPFADYTFAPDGFEALVAAAEDEWLACADDGPP